MPSTSSGDPNRQRHEAVHALLREGRSLRGIRRDLELGYHTVRRFAFRAENADELLVNAGQLLGPPVHRSR